MFEDINETAKDLAGVITRMEDAETVASVIRNALVVERTAHMREPYIRWFRCWSSSIT
ncbi:hypothetical protein SmphiM12_288 [Sinorhizobium phage phiM12]|uniref:Uncharacterized protein n=1 Tax=Sinorhizobium phage phiM12 TaxID=1357423 RepID=S5MQ11_9CAUD|nr:hypothetical protein AB690_gp288 [Sinorhizobium phage phiM12]AGR47920.2 hypothetical protein SmphiM12_288 [Sinorhizobium phage phiM12]AKF13123.1 hypothetical protein PHIM19_218 [Sinorhizobium phage phiM19]